eukprot:1124324-Prymnesium_polylepis.1
MPLTITLIGEGPSATLLGGASLGVATGAAVGEAVGAALHSRIDVGDVPRTLAAANGVITSTAGAGADAAHLSSRSCVTSASESN